MLFQDITDEQLSTDKPIQIVNSDFDVLKSIGKFPVSLIDRDDIKAMVSTVIKSKVDLKAQKISDEFTIDIFPLEINDEVFALLKVNNQNSGSNNREVEHRVLTDFTPLYSTDLKGKELFNSILKFVVNRTESDYGMIAEILHNEGQDKLSCIAFSNNGEITGDFTAAQDDIFYKEIFNGETVIHLNNAKRDFLQDKVITTFAVEGFICQPLKDENGNTGGLLCIMQKTQINEPEYLTTVLNIAAKRCEMEFQRLHYEKLVEQKNFELNRQNKDMASFTYIASHDLQEPLRKIRMFNSRILEKDASKLSESALGYFKSINSTADRMQNLINALLTYSSMDSDDLSTERVNLNKLLKEVLKMMADLLEDRNVTIDADNLPTLQIIPTQFQQLLYNLLNNAVKYAKADIPANIKISAKTHLVGRQNFWRIDIADNGIGFDPQYKEKIFEVFQRLHGKQEYAGTGVGLAICTKVAKNHRGHITADAVPGEGATFSIFIPAK